MTLKFRFPDGSWNQQLKPDGDSYVAFWEDEDGAHIWELSEEETFEVDDSDDGEWYHE